MNEDSNNELSSFEDIKFVDPTNSEEFWGARALSKVLGYREFRNFTPVLENAKQACLNSKEAVENHFVDYHEMVPIGSGAERSMPSVKLSRYACYLTVQNASPSKVIVAQGQTYFAIQTRRQELADDAAFQQLKEDEKRVFLRKELKEHNKQLVETAQKAGVETSLDFAIFLNHGYKGLYGGLDNNAIHRHKGLKKSQKILDHMGSTELAANLFRATQTEEKLKRDEIKSKKDANQTHHDVGAKVRETIQELGGTMPEDLPTPEQGIKSLENKMKRIEKKSDSDN